MAESHDLGQQGENLAEDHLKKSGYKILYRNWRWGKHEVDIIAEKDNLIVFVEVKTRTADFIENLRYVITSEKQKSIILAANGYLQKFSIDQESRFDVLTIIKSGNEEKIEHIEDAFYPTLR